MNTSMTASDIEYFQDFLHHWEKWAVSRSWSALNHYLADDFVLLPPDHPRIDGREAAITWFGNFPAIVACESRLEDVQGGPDFVLLIGHVVMTVEPAPGQRVSIRGKWSSAWRREARWMCTSNMWNADQPPG